MITTFERLPNEILLEIFSDLSWAQLLTSFGSLNERFNLLICSSLSRIDKQHKMGFVVGESGLSFNQCYSLFTSSISNSLSLFTSSIRRIHFDGRNSNACDLIDQWLYNREQGVLRFPNLKSLILTQCLSIGSLIKTLPILIKYHLDTLTLSFDEDMIQSFEEFDELSLTNLEKYKENVSKFENLVNAFKFRQLIRQLFSNDCGLNSLRLDLACGDNCLDIHECLKSRHNAFPCSIFNPFQESSCLTLRHLHLHLQYTCCFEHIMEYVPSLEELSVYFQTCLKSSLRSTDETKRLVRTNGKWYDKVPKLRCFELRATITDDGEFAYLKWILNNLNHIQKLRIHLESAGRNGYYDQLIWASVVDANFIRRYCIPAETINLTDFDFYVLSKCKSSTINAEQISHSFKIHPFFVYHGWTNVNYVYDPKISWHHLSSFIVDLPQLCHNLVFRGPDLFVQTRIRCISVELHSSLYSFLERFNELFPHVFQITVHLKYHETFTDPDGFSLLKIPFKLEQRKLSDIRLQNVTTLAFDRYFSRGNIHTHDEHLIERTKGRAKLLAQLISMPVQLKTLRINHFKWLLNIIRYASNELRRDALKTVRYVELGICSCHRGPNEHIRIGANLIPYLTTFMPHLHTLRLWRPDDFPWTSIRPHFTAGYFCSLYAPRWYRTLLTPEMINKAVNNFEQDLCRLVEQMKEFVFLDIHGKIDEEKVKPYHSMVERRFPSSRIHVDKGRFRLWL